MYDQNNINPIVKAQTEDDNERIILSHLPSGYYDLEVKGHLGSTGNYSISFSDEYDPSTGDQYELSTIDSNNKKTSATDLTHLVGKQKIDNLSIHNTNDIDYYKIKLIDTAADDHYISIKFDNSQGDLELQLENSARIFAKSDSAFDSERINLNGLGSNYLFFSVRGDNIQNTSYSIDFNLPESTTKTRVIKPDSNENSNGVEEINKLQISDLKKTVSRLSIHSPSDFDLYSFELENDASSTDYIQIIQSDEKGLYRLDYDDQFKIQLFDQTGSNSLTEFSSRVANQWEEDTEVLLLDGIKKGSYVLKVFGSREDDIGNYTLKFNSGAPISSSFKADIYDNNNNNDTKELATDLEIISSNYSLENLSFHQSDDIDWFKFEFDATTTLSKLISSSNQSGNVTVSLYEDINGTLSEQSFVEENYIGSHTFHNEFSLKKNWVDPESGDPWATKPPTAEKKYYLKVISDNVQDYSLDIFTDDYSAPILPEEDLAEINGGNNTWETAYDLGVIDGSNGPLELNTLSLHNRGDIDFYKFTTIY